MKLNKIDEVWNCANPPEILLPWQRDITNSPLYYTWVQNCIPKTCIACSTKTFLDSRGVFLQYAKIEQVKQKALLAGYTVHNTNKQFVVLPVYMWTQLWKLEVVILIFAKKDTCPCVLTASDILTGLLGTVSPEESIFHAYTSYRHQLTEALRVQILLGIYINHNSH